MITIYILYLFTFLLGFYLGSKRNIQKDISTISKTTKDMLQGKEELKIGPIKRPDIQKIQSSQMPDSKKEGIKAMEKTLRDIPELNI